MPRLLTIASALLLLALLLRSEIIGVAALTLGVAGIWGSYWARAVTRGLRIQRHAPTHLANGEEASVRLTIENGSLLRAPWLALRESVTFNLRSSEPNRTVIALGAGAKEEISYPIRGSRRGWYSLGPLQIALGDVLGLQQATLSVAPAWVTVYPRLLPLNQLGLPADLSGGPLPPAGPRPYTEDPARPVGVRHYVPGDDVRRLDWKSSARKGELLVRRADRTIAPETTIALAFARHEYPAGIVHDSVERAATAAASIAVALLTRKLPVGLVTSGLDPQSGSQGLTLPAAKGNAQRQALLGVFGRLAVGGDTDIWALLANTALPWGGTLIVVLSDLDLVTLPKLLAMRRRGQQPVVILVEGSVGGLALAQQQHIAAYRIDRRGMPVVERS